jgi:two-component system, sensor histidine kinase and response regulator
MNQKLFNVLLVEDNLGDVFLIQEQFKSAKTFEYSIVHVDYLHKAITYLEQSPCDVILLDLSLPDSQGIETLKTIAKKALQIPIVILTGTNDEELAIRAVRQGAQDYFVKGQVMGKVLVHALHYAIERKLIEEQLKTRTSQLEASNQELEAFSYTVSHDLKNPLTVIKGMTKLLRQKYDLEQRDEQEQRFLKHICDSSDRMEQIIRDLLILSQVKKSELEIKPINLSDLAQSIGDRLQQQETARQVKLTIQPQIIAIGDQRLLMYALENLLHNAWKYTGNKQDPCIEVGVIDANPSEVSKNLHHIDLEAIVDLHQRNRIRAAYRNLVYFVRDNGLGFELKSAEQLFTPFHRLPNAKKFEGNGIGLAIVQRIIHRHDGRIWAEAAAGEGATFYFTLAI